MRKIIVTEFATIDAIIGDPGGSEKTAYGGWSFDYWIDDIGKFKLQELMESDALLLGRVTYEGFAAAWPTMKDDAGFADKMNSMKKYVVSSTLHNPSWNNTTVIKGDPGAEIEKLKKEDGKTILVPGSARLVTFLAEKGLADEYNLLVYPTALNRGKRMLPGLNKRIKLKLLQEKTFKSGVVLLRYSRTI